MFHLRRKIWTKLGMGKFSLLQIYTRRIWISRTVQYKYTKLWNEFSPCIYAIHTYTHSDVLSEPRRENDLPFRISAIDAKTTCHTSQSIYIYIYYLCVNSDEIIGVPVAGLNDPCNQLCPPLGKVRVSPHPFLSFFFIFFLFYFFSLSLVFR